VEVSQVQRNDLGRANSVLGEDLVLGRRVADRSGKFRVHVRALGWQRFHDFLPTGKACQPLRSLVRLTLRDSAGRQREESVARGQQDLNSHEKFGFRMLAGDVAYISLDHFESDEGVKAFTKALPQIMRAKGLIIDVRRNGGGSGVHGERILEHLTRQAIPRAMSFMRGTSIVAGAQSRLVTWEPVARSAPAHSRDGDVYEGPVAVLTSAATFSAAEDFVLAFNALGR
ncbi:hypothetical protein LTR94_030364, partial [Friedmanniomyces endolithicus]